MEKQKSSAMVLDTSEVRKALRKNVPQIDKLENLAGLKNLELKLVDDTKRTVLIFYECVASQELYPNVGEKLIEKEVIREDNLMNSWIDDKGKYNECMTVHMGLDFPGDDVLVWLMAYNPNYK